MIECVCERCGEKFVGRAGRRFCSKNCADMASHERCGGSENEKLEREMCIDRAQRRQERLAMKARLAERDAAFAAEFPLLASGAVRGTKFCGTFGKRSEQTPLDVATHKSEIVESEWSKKESARQKKARTKEKGIELLG